MREGEEEERGSGEGGEWEMGEAGRRRGAGAGRGEEIKKGVSMKPGEGMLGLGACPAERLLHLRQRRRPRIGTERRAFSRDEEEAQMHRGTAERERRKGRKKREREGRSEEREAERDHCFEWPRNVCRDTPSTILIPRCTSVHKVLHAVSKRNGALYRALQVGQMVNLHARGALGGTSWQTYVPADVKNLVHVEDSKSSRHLPKTITIHEFRKSSNRAFALLSVDQFRRDLGVS
ncbi:hypothetical protein KM043_006244 [Ampulex compressa]|nr:hypothetical protein KM043_006244 [Ampulex compressa]